jgi:hypothetical protein
MALTWNGMQCAICREPIQDTSRDILGFTAWAISDPRFARLDDAAVHQSCIDNWHLRDDFIDYYNQTCRDELRVNRRGHVCYRVDWFDTLTETGLVSVFGYLFLPVMPWAEHVPDDSCLIQSFVGLALIGLLVLAASVTASYLGALLGVTIILGLWLVLGLIAALVMRHRSP